MSTIDMSKEATARSAMKLALEALEWEEAQTAYPARMMIEAITALREALNASLAEPDFWEGYVPEPVKPAQQRCMRCNTPKKCALYGCSPLTWPSEKPARQEPVAFPARKAVEREIERTANPTGMHLNDGKERVALPGGTLRHMLALIDRTSPPSLSLAQRPWRGLTDEERGQIINANFGAGLWSMAKDIEAKLKEKNCD